MEPSRADMPDSRMYELLARSIGGRLLPADEGEVRRATCALFARPDGLELLREVAIEEGMLRILLARVHTEHAEPEQRGSRTPSIRDRRGRTPFGLRWRRLNRAASWRRNVLKAATILVVVGGAAGVGTRGALRWFRRGTSPTPPTPHSVTTSAGQRATIDLPDGSQVILAPNSELRYAVARDAGPRELQLDGEAYFAVQHDVARPFRVHTRRAVIEDLGTTFVVRAYPTDPRAHVAVRSGAVTIRARTAHDSTVTTLRPGEAAAFDSSGSVVRLAGNPAADWAWITGRLAFDQTQLPAVLAQLHRWYDVDFRLDDSTLATQYFTGAFDAATPLPHVLEILGPLVHARFERRGRIVTVTPRPRTP
jgi:transmembrane sensor